MYLLSDSSFQDMQDEILRLAMESVAQKGYARTARKNGYSPEQPARSAEQDFSEVARETLKTLRGEWAGGPSYANIYFTEISATVRRDVAQAMIYRWTQDGRGYGAFDEIALLLFEHYFDHFEDMGSSKFIRSDQKNSATLSFKELQEKILDPFIDEHYDRSLTVRFEFKTAKSPVKLKLEIGVTGNAVWELRGLSQLQRSHQKLRDDLQSVVRDFRSRMGWVAEYMGSGPKPGLGEPQLSIVQNILQNYYHEGPIDLEPLEPGVRFEDEPLVLERRARGFIGRCQRCDQIVALELVKDLSSDGSRGNWADSSLVYENRYAEEALGEKVFRPVHWACSGTHYLSSRTGTLMPINS